MLTPIVERLKRMPTPQEFEWAFQAQKQRFDEYAEKYYQGKIEKAKQNAGTGSPKPGASTSALPVQDDPDWNLYVQKKISHEEYIKRTVNKRGKT